MTKLLLWLDLEMTGLDETRDQILEVAAAITDFELTEKARFHRVVFQPPEVVQGMNDWCKKTHGESGLTAAIPGGTPLPQVESELLAWLDESFPKDERMVLAGNSIHNDRRFIDRYLAAFASRLHYRMIDVSSYKEIFRERFGVHFKKGNSHRAIEDVFESVNELKHYLSFVQVKKT